MLLATRNGKAIRFPVADVRVFAGRSSVGVRGIALARAATTVISMSILRHEEVAPEMRNAYLQPGARPAPRDGRGERGRGEPERRQRER